MLCYTLCGTISNTFPGFKTHIQNIIIQFACVFINCNNINKNDNNISTILIQKITNPGAY